MDARDRLRRYLEQRREVGESELILDGMPVEDLLALIGAKAQPASRKVAGPAAHAAPSARSVTPEAATPAPAVVAEPVAPPPPPAPRFAEGATADWRQTLRAAESAGGTTPPATPPAAPSATSTMAPVATDVWPSWLTALELPTGLTVSSTALVSPSLASLNLDGVAQQVAACTACALHERARHAVPGEGNPAAEVVCVGEGPGEQEDAQGVPFVGPSGDLLTKMLAGIQINRADVFICNVVKHRPPANRDPLPEEVAACMPYLHRQLDVVRPRVILALGRAAAQAVLATDTALGRLRGQIHRYQGIPVIVTYHPAALLRNEEWKRPAWQDLKMARRILDAARAAAPSDTPRGS